MHVSPAGDASPAIGLHDRRLTLQRVDRSVDQDPSTIAGQTSAASAGDRREILLAVTDAVADLAFQPAHDSSVPGHGQSPARWYSPAHRCRRMWAPVVARPVPEPPTPESTARG